MVGEQEPDALPALFAAADAFVFPTLADEWGVVVNEALAAGLPVLGSVHSQAVEELCAEGETGWIFDPGGPGLDARCDRPRVCDAGGAASADERQRAANARRELTPDWAADRVVQALLGATRASR